jgi:hypothetical protein
VLLAISRAWIAGWAAGALVVVVAAVLLVAIIALGRRLARQAREITAALDGARAHTDALYDVGRTNLAVDRCRRGVRALRGEAAQ